MIGGKLLSTRVRVKCGFSIRGSKFGSAFTTAAAQLPLAKLDFSDPKSAFASKTTAELFRGCMYGLSLRILGNTLTHKIIEKTLFRHFCAGVDEQDIIKPIMRLQQVGVGGILDYAAESKEEDTDEVEEGKLMLRSSARSRVHLYEGEAKCDENTKIFLHAVRAVRNVSENGFAAVKLSGLGEPALLERVSMALIEIERFFFLLGGKRKVDFKQFLDNWKEHFNYSSSDQVRSDFDKFDVDRDGYIDIVDWMSHLSLIDLSQMVSSCKSEGPLFRAALTEEELTKLKNLLNRCDQICGLANQLKVRVMLDAEWTAIQPAIDHITMHMQRKYNKTTLEATTLCNDGHPSKGYRPTVYSTYQSYLINSFDRVKDDLERSKREGWRFGAKIVRGAYMVSELERANKLGIPSPIFPTYRATEDNYHSILEYLIKDKSTEVMVASHNERTMQFVVSRMASHNKANCQVSFGQLLGMADNLTLTLGANKFNAYKYIPYGPVDEVMPYLIRRTQENSTLLGTPAVVKERKMLAREIRRRIIGV